MTRLQLASTDDHGQPVTIELLVRRETVECWAGRHLAAVFDRELLKSWLAAPRGFYEIDEVAFCRTQHSVALSIFHRIHWHDLPTTALADLRSRLRE